MIIYLIRHGETDLNKQKRLQGQTDIPLNEYGRQLARITGQALSEVCFDYVFSSPLSRALETAEIIVGSRTCDLITEERIQEISFGEYEGLCYGAENFNIPDPDFLNFFSAPDVYVTPPKGENFKDVIARTGEFFKELTGNPEYEDKTVLVSTHGCALKALLANICRTQIKDFWGAGVHKNCAVTIVEAANGIARVIEEGRIFY